MEDILYVVVVNDEGQYSIWDSERAVPAGWRVKAPAATKTACLDYVLTHWTDMTPLSLRSHLAS